MSARKTFSRLGFVLLLVMAVAQGGQVLLDVYKRQVYSILNI